MATNTQHDRLDGDAAPSAITEQAEALVDQFPDNVGLDVADVEAQLSRLVSEYKVPLQEAGRAVTNRYLEETELEFDDLDIPSRSDNEPVALDSVTEEGQWITVIAKVVDLWEPRADSIAQVGLLGDESGTLKFTKWRKADLPELEEDAVYRFENVVTDEYEGRYSVNLNSNTEIERLDTDIEVGQDGTVFEGALVAIQSGSGLIKRCPHEDCTRVLNNSRCAEHGQVDGEFDLRIKAVFDDGHEVQHAIFDQEATEAMVGTSLEEAKQLAMDALDTSVVVDEFRDSLVGRYYRTEGPVFGRYLLVDEAEQLGAPTDDVGQAIH